MRRFGAIESSLATIPEGGVGGSREDLVPGHHDAVDGSLVAGVVAAEGAGFGVVGADHAVAAAGEH